MNQFNQNPPPDSFNHWAEAAAHCAVSSLLELYEKDPQTSREVIINTLADQIMSTLQVHVDCLRATAVKHPNESISAIMVLKEVMALPRVRNALTSKVRTRAFKALHPSYNPFKFLYTTSRGKTYARQNYR